MTREQLRRVPFNARRVAASNGLHMRGHSHREGWLSMLLLYALALYGGFRFFADIALPFIRRAL